MVLQFFLYENMIKRRLWNIGKSFYQYSSIYLGTRKNDHFAICGCNRRREQYSMDAFFGEHEKILAVLNFQMNYSSLAL